MTRRDYAGGARKALLTGALTTTTMTIACDDLSGWPTGGPGPFYAVIDRNTPSEEKLLCSDRTGNTLTVIQRGADSTTAKTHIAGAEVEHVFTSVDADEANAHVNAAAGVHGLGGSTAVVGTDTAQTLTNKTLSGTDNSFSNIPQAAVTGLPAALTALDSAIDAETAARIAAVNAEAVARAADVDAEEAARIADVNAEEAARIAADALLLPLAGGTLTGDLVLAADPNAPLEAATKQYVDTAIDTDIAAHVAAADAHPDYAPVMAGEYTKSWVRSLTFNGSGAAAFTHGQASAPIAVVCNAELGASRVTVHPGATDSTNINIKAFNSDSTVYVGSLSQVHIIATFAQVRPT